MDVRDMSEFPDASFDVVLDKSIIDTLACSTGSVENIDLMLKEVRRLACNLHFHLTCLTAN